MKLILAITCLVFCALGVSSHEIRAKRGFSEDAIKKMTDSLNKDREEILKKTNFPFQPTSSRSDYEKQAEMLDCSKDYSEEHGVPLQMNDVAEELLKKLKHLIGKTIMINGMCTTYGDSQRDEKFESKMKTMDLPHPSKYGDLLGVPKPKEEVEEDETSATITSSGNASAVDNGASLNSFFFLISLFLAFYI